MTVSDQIQRYTENARKFDTSQLQSDLNGLREEKTYWERLKKWTKASLRTDPTDHKANSLLADQNWHLQRNAMLTTAILTVLIERGAKIEPEKAD